MAVREGFKDADAPGDEAPADGDEEKIVYVLHPNCAVEELGVGDRGRGRRRA